MIRDGDICNRFQERTAREKRECEPDPPHVDLYEAVGRLPDCGDLANITAWGMTAKVPSAYLGEILDAHRATCHLYAAIASEDLLFCLRTAGE